MKLTESKKAPRRRRVTVIVVIAALLIAALGIWLAVKKMTRIHYASDFGFEDIKSAADADGDGIDDYTDMKKRCACVYSDKPDIRQQIL